MKKLLVALSILMLCAGLCALAEEENDAPPTSIDMFLGVWEAKEKPELTLTVVPGSYTPHHTGWSQTDFYAEGRWRETDEWTVIYSLNVGSIGSVTPVALGGGLLGLALDSFKHMMNEWEDLENKDYSILHYTEGTIDALEAADTENYLYNYFDITSGSLILYFDEDKTLTLFWVDEKDPHLYAYSFLRKTVDVPTPEALTEGVVRPILEMTDDTREQVAVSLMRFAVDNSIAMADCEQLAKNLVTASDALTDAEARRFGENYNSIDELLTTTIMQIPDPYATEYHHPAFEASGLEEDVANLLDFNIVDRRSADLLCAAIHTLVYEE